MKENRKRDCWKFQNINFVQLPGGSLRASNYVKRNRKHKGSPTGPCNHNPHSPHSSHNNTDQGVRDDRNTVLGTRRETIPDHKTNTNSEQGPPSKASDQEIYECMFKVLYGDDYDKNRQQQQQYKKLHTHYIPGRDSIPIGELLNQ